jgi:ABC-type phosphate transport system substrate-binding protein
MPPRRRLLTLFIAGLLAVPAAAVPVASAAPAPAVAADQSTNLVDQVVHVTWSGFVPSSSSVLSDGTHHVVRVYQCKGASPVSAADCYGSQLYEYGTRGSSNNRDPDGPSNAITTITQPDGTGSADIEVRTITQSATLACSSTVPCSLVVVPNDGEPDPSHPGEIVSGTDTQPLIDGTNINGPGTWKDWAFAKAVADKLVIPLSFSPAGGVCAFAKSPDATAAGSPEVQRLVEQWQPKLCRLAKPVSLDYTTLGEPSAQSNFEAKLSDVAFTTLPDGTTAQRPYTYAPLSTSGIAIAYRIDNADTGRPITDLKLSPRLVAKLVTESYGMGASCTTKKCDKATVGNPLNIFQDPEFLKLNGSTGWPITSGWLDVVSGNQNLTWELTRWLAADAATKKFLAGTKDSSGMQVNTGFKGISYPVAQFDARDANPQFVHGFIPLLGLDAVASYLVTNRDNSETYVPNPITGNYDKTGPIAVGNRALIAIVSTSDAAALRFPVARILNGAGKYVAPTDASMAAAISAMKTNPDKITQHADFTSKNAAAYPLTMTHYAQVPTNGIGAVKAEKIGRLLDYAAAAGQVHGTAIGQLPVGYVALTAAQKAETVKAAAAVRAQKGVLPAPGSNNKPSPSPSTSPNVPGNTKPNLPGAGNPSVQLPLVAGPAPLGGRLSGNISALVQWTLPTLVLLGLAAGVLGPGLYGSGNVIDPEGLERWRRKLGRRTRRPGRRRT